MFVTISSIWETRKKMQQGNRSRLLNVEVWFDGAASSFPLTRSFTRSHDCRTVPACPLGNRVSDLNFLFYFEALDPYSRFTTHWPRYRIFPLSYPALPTFVIQVCCWLPTTLPCRRNTVVDAITAARPLSSYCCMTSSRRSSHICTS